MHELGVAQEILKIALESAAKNNARKITQLNIEMGALDESEISLRFHIENISRGTTAEGARVQITRIPAQMQCLDCGNVFTLEAPGPACPHCSGPRFHPLVRDEFRLASIEVE